MKRKRFTEEQVAAVLHPAELGIEVKDLCRKFAFTEQILLSLEKAVCGNGNSKLKRIVADLTPDFSKNSKTTIEASGN